MSQEQELKQFVLMNKKTGEVGIGFRLSFFDNEMGSELDVYKDYKISVTANEPDFWAILSPENNFWLVVMPDLVQDALEILGEL